MCVATISHNKCWWCDYIQRKNNAHVGIFYIGNFILNLVYNVSIQKKIIAILFGLQETINNFCKI